MDGKMSKGKNIENKNVENKNMSNEILYEIFEYLEHNDIYHGFFYLNDRFQNLLINLNIPFRINLSTIPKSHVDLYNKNVFQPNKHRINILRLSNPFTIELIFSPPCLLFVISFKLKN
ncbi:unnamed protein product [Rotaria sp. Silwood1]|nr:unnamed protein product [Rotaria sp. Silwood1]